MRAHTIPFLLTCALFWSSHIRAEEFPPVPEKIALLISVRSANELLDRTGDFIAAASPKKMQSIPPGMPRMVAQMAFPVMNWDVFDLDAPAFFLVPQGADPEKDNAVLLPTADFDSFMEIIEANSTSIRNDEEYDCKGITMPTAGEYFVAKLGEGLAILSRKPKLLGIVRAAYADGWRPRHWGESLMRVDYVAPPHGWRQAMPPLAEVLDDLETELRREQPKLPPVPSFEEKMEFGLKTAVLDLLPATTRELDGFRRIGAELFLDEEHALVRILVQADPDTLLGASAATASGREAVSFFDDVEPGNDAAAILVNAPMGEILPGFGETAHSLFGQMFQEAFPDRMAEWQDALRNFSAHAAGPNMAAVYIEKNESHIAVWMRSDEPDKGVRAMVDVFAMGEEIVARLEQEDMKFARPYTIDITEEVTSSGVPYTRIGPPEEFSVEAQGSRPSKPAVSGLLHSLDSLFYSFSVAAKDGYVVMVLGVAGRDEMEAALSAVGREETALWRGPSAREAIAGLGGRQHSTALLNLNFLCLDYAERTLADVKKARKSPTKTIDKAYDRARSQFIESNDVAGTAAGARNGAVTLDYYISAEAASVLAHNITVIRDFSKRMETSKAASKKKAARKKSVRSNERDAIAALMMYATAQVSYRLVFESGYADDFRRLFLREHGGEPVELIPEPFANARLGDDGVSYNGYVFIEDAAVADWDEDYGLFAYPEQYGVTGNRVFWIGSDNEVMCRDPHSARGEPPPAFGEDDSPLADPDAWDYP